MSSRDYRLSVNLNLEVNDPRIFSPGITALIECPQVTIKILRVVIKPFSAPEKPDPNEEEKREVEKNEEVKNGHE